MEYLQNDDHQMMLGRSTATLQPFDLQVNCLNAVTSMAKNFDYKLLEQGQKLAICEAF